MNIHDSVSFGARFLSDNERDITYDYSTQYNKFETGSVHGSDVRISKIESTGNYNAAEDNQSLEQNYLLMDEDNMKA